MVTAQTRYSDLAAVLDALPQLARETRRSRRLSVRAAARQVGVAHSVIARVESGRSCVTTNAARILRWMDRP